MSVVRIVGFSALVALGAALCSVSTEADADSGPSVRPAQAWELIAGSDSTEAVTEEVMRRRVEMLLRNGRREDAVQLLEDRRERFGLEPSLTRRLARLYDQLGRYEDLETLLEERMAQTPEHELADLRMLAEARLALGKRDQASEIIAEILARDPQDPGLIRLVATMLSHHALIEDAIVVLLEGREEIGDPYEFSQHLGSLYAESGQWAEAVGEYLKVIVVSPLNVGLMRGQILDLAEEPEALAPILEEANARFVTHPEVPQLGLVVAELRQRAGDADGAWEILEPMVGEGELLQDLIQMAMAGLADSRLDGADPARALSSLRLSAKVLRGLLRGEELPRTLEPRVYDTLNRTLLAILENKQFTRLEDAEQLSVLAETRSTILEMGQRFPNNRLTASALLKLAGIYVDSLHRASEAIDLYRRLQMDPSAPREQLQMAQVGLGVAFIAAGDTLEARKLFTRMGKDRSFEGGQGRAHYHLGLLDFMGGHFQTAQERLSSVAVEAPTAGFTNDSLDLALLLAEQKLSGAPDEVGLAGYGRALYYTATFQPDSLVTQLRALTTARGAGLQQRARLDLARHYHGVGAQQNAITELDALVRNSAYSRYAASALDLKGDILVELGNLDGARESFKAVLLEHDSYVFIDSVRDKLRKLPGGEEVEGDLP